MGVETTVATAGSTCSTGSALVSVLSISFSVDPQVVMYLVVSQIPRGYSFSSAPLSSSLCGIGAGEPSDGIDPETSPRSYHSSSRKQQTLFAA